MFSSHQLFFTKYITAVRGSLEDVASLFAHIPQLTADSKQPTASTTSLARQHGDKADVIG